jgi:phage protein D
MSMTSVDPTASQARNTRGKAPVASLMRNGILMDATVTEMTVNYAEGQHDQAILSCVSSTLENTDGFVDSTFSFYFGAAPRSALFQGYISAVTDEQDAQGQLSFKLTMLGASKAMFAGQPRYWSNKTIPDAVRDLTSANMIGFYGQSHTYVWRALAQTEESDWQMLKSLATRIGWVVYYRFGVILLYEPNSLYINSGEYTTLVASQTNPDTSDTYESRNMIEFQATEDAEVLPQNLGKRFGFFTTANDVQIKEQTGTYKGFLFETDTTVRDQDEATVFITAADSTIAGWRLHAVARIWGDADIYPGMCVNVKTTTGYSKNDGRWLVRSVSHQADRSQYQTQLLLSRPKNWVRGGLLAYRPFWEQNMASTRARPYLQDLQGKWYSSWRAAA